MASKTKAIVGKEPKKIAIVGCSDTRDQAPFDDESFEIWGVNNLFYHIPRWTRWFEIHLIEHNGNRWIRRGDLFFKKQPVEEYIAGLAKHKTPIYMQRQWPEIPTSTPYPIKEIITYFGDYFTNTISYMIALAIYEIITKYDIAKSELHVYGVDMAVDTEYHWQRPSCEFFLGWAKGLGIKTFIPPQADLLKIRYLYGFQEPEIEKWKKKVKHIKEHMLQRQNSEAQNQKIAEQKYHQYSGALMALKEIDKVWK